VVLTRMVAGDVVGDLGELAAAHKKVFSAVGTEPAQTTFGGTLVRDTLKVEIEATAVVNSAPPQHVPFGAAPWGDLTHSSRAVRVGDVIQISGTVFPADSASDEVEGCFEIIGEAIKAAGGRGLEDVVLTRMVAGDVVGDLGELAAAHKEVFSAVGTEPAQTTFGGTLVRDTLKVEIEATAVVTPDRPKL
jgi:enamine deaminase RidA (YjgF/YER057c/UK114 family)